MRYLIFLIAAFSLVSCGKKSHSIDTETHTYVAAILDEKSEDPEKLYIPQVFLMEHPSIEDSSTEPIKDAIKYNPPGGFVLWNSERNTASETREIIQEYSALHQKTNSDIPPLLYSIDYEGGHLKNGITTTKGKRTGAIARIKSGLTPLAWGDWLGESLDYFEDNRLCQLHGSLMAKELKSIGINYPLANVSDLAIYYFRRRGISTNPLKVSECTKAILDSFALEKDIIFVTKHFPGLGSIKTDTHNGDSISSITTKEEMNNHLFPFRDLIVHSNTTKTSHNLSVMTGHGIYPALDPNVKTNESKKIKQDILIDKFGFQGISVTDAMWMGVYEKESWNNLKKIYLKTFLTGSDLLMIPGYRFKSSIIYFRSVYDGNLSEVEKEDITQFLEVESFREVQKELKKRLALVKQRAYAVRSKIDYPANYLSEIDQEPMELSRELRNSYYKLLVELDRALGLNVLSDLTEE